MPQPPSFPFYPGDWIAGTGRLTLAEKGAYIDALAHQWHTGEGVPGDDVRMLARILRCAPAEAKRIWPAIANKFEKGADGLFVNRRLEDVRREKQKFHDARRAGGEKGAASRWKPTDGRSRAERMADAKSKGTHTEAEWDEMLRAYAFKCLKCGCVPVGRPCRDHIVAVSLGGDDSIQNLQPMCRECNTSKGHDQTDYRIGHAATLAKWLPVTDTATGSPTGLATDSTTGSSSSSSSSPEPTAQRDARAIPVQSVQGPPVPSPRRSSHGDPFGMRLDKNAAAHIVVGEGQMVSIPAAWATKACREYGLTIEQIDTFATWCTAYVRAEGFEDGGKRLPWLDARLAEWRRTRRSTADSDAAARRTEEFLAEQAEHRAKRGTADEILEGLRAGRAQR